MKQLKSALLNNNKIKIFNVNNKLRELNLIIVFKNTVKKI